MEGRGVRSGGEVVVTRKVGEGEGAGCPNGARKAKNENELRKI